MLIKATLLGVFAASTPLYLVATQNPADQDPARDAEPNAVTAGMVAEPEAPLRELDRAVERHAEELERLRALHADVLERAEAAEARAEDLTRQLHECMDFLLEPRPRHNSCRPNRRPISKHYQWMRENGHDEHAEKALAGYIEQIGDKNRNLNSAAWHLMTDKRTAGQYDELALGLANRMQAKGGLDHRQIDTVALAKFLNGHVDEAIALQKKAVKQCNDDDYRRRLRTYEAAKKNTCDKPAEAKPEKAKPKEKRKISDDD